jgi:hypothetical protein
LIFDQIDSGYLASVATQEGAGRSATAQLLHASEAAFWVALLEQMAALMQTVPDIDGTEIILETAGNEFGDDFHKLWRSAEAGESEFLPIFLPWSIDPTYRTKVPDEFNMTAEERKDSRTAWSGIVSRSIGAGVRSASCVARICSNVSIR